MTRDAEHTPSPQSVVVPVDVLNEAAGILDCEGYGPLSMSLLSCLSAPAPSSLAGGATGRLSALLSSDHLRGDYPLAGLGAVSWNDLRAILAALSQEAPEPAVLVRDRFGTILDHLTTAPEGWELRRVTEAPAREATAFAMNGPMTTHATLRSANIARQDEWDQDGQITASYRGNELAGEVGEACNVIKKLERERLGILGSRATVGELADELADVLICADLIAMHYGIDLEAAVARKFNATSEKVGLQTRLAAPNDGGEE